MALCSRFDTEFPRDPRERVRISDGNHPRDSIQNLYRSLVSEDAHTDDRSTPDIFYKYFKPPSRMDSKGLSGLCLRIGKYFFAPSAEHQTFSKLYARDFSRNFFKCRSTIRSNAWPVYARRFHAKSITRRKAWSIDTRDHLQAPWISLWNILKRVIGLRSRFHRQIFFSCQVSRANVDTVP